jgi:hypothetical protein
VLDLLDSVGGQERDGLALQLAWHVLLLFEDDNASLSKHSRPAGAANGEEQVGGYRCAT